MQCIVTALKAESDPFIQYFGLKRARAFSFPCFINDDVEIALVGVGVGTKNIRERINNFSTVFDDKVIQFINVGIAGGNKDQTRIGQLFLINKIIDDSTKKIYYPDILIDHSLMESPITTVERGIYDGGGTYDYLVDMEAFEIFLVCSKIVPIHNVAIIKVISDHMETPELDFDHDMISLLITKKMDKVTDFIDQFKLIGRMNDPILSKTDMDWVQHNKEKYLLTVTQVNQLMNTLKSYRLNNPSITLPKINAQRPMTKIDQKNTFIDIREKLKA